MNWTESCDAVVVGSGNGGLVAALCLYEMGVKDVLVVESSDQAGGTSALSGGGVWIPGNPYAQAEGISDSYDDALAYVLATDPDGTVPREMIETYLKNAPAMLRFMHARTRMRYRSLAHYPDYFSTLPGSRTGHRSIEPEPMNITKLKRRGQYLRDHHPILKILGRVPMTQTEAHVFNVQAPGWRLLAAKLLMQYFLDVPQRLRTRRARRATCGSAGVARLLWSMEERNLRLDLKTEMIDLVLERGKVTGVIVRTGGRQRNIECRRGVVLASGGFEHNQRMRETHLPAPTHTSWTTTHKGNLGAPIEIANRHGAQLARMHGAWWVPTFRVPGIPYPYPSIMEKSYPGSIVVNKGGKRVANESMNYQMYVRECHRLHEEGTDTSHLWIIFDADFREKYIVSPILSSKLMPDRRIPKAYFDESFLTRADSLEALALAVGIDAAGIKATVERFNRFATTGKDEEFGRGDSEYDRYYADPSVKPNPCLAPIRRGPFYAVRIYLGEFGTNGGLDIDVNAQVRNTQGQPIQGLYATGNCAAAILPAYPGPGSTLGPSMTFAYQAAKHISGVTPTE
ncbi:FAD-dependent oxidoreductase [Pseudomonas vancouverensis]|uniref:FAD-dependent oxidoreductase n=1 Tax=Pseudomonas vancouverensis TaxID=95300 RepID=A0A1H2ML27_PSEVA|nr:FAD-dependent oxidoreductase [Pseudomonas vancouverensis]KAB0494747.1 FAD-dependent oxidoreductase [Pseudomonas vancouverensis]TDB59413.1 FAD-dependent oxidoreductase [Pseudomonas vancouverensis]SDU93725.1 3-oxosteroid 1-dehydrogenase [Pseudomonas vancouverensis]